MGTPLSFHRHVRDHGGDDGHGHDGRDDDLHACACEAFQLPQAPMYSHVHAHDHARDHVIIMIIPIPCETFRKNILLDNIFVLSIFSYTLSGTIKNLNYQNV
jgi:hypothetical protein